jgi:hypothetical protein
MSVLRLEDLVVGAVFAVAVAVSAYSLVEPDEASPLAASASVVMERGEPAEQADLVEAGAATACTCVTSEAPAFVATLLR